MGEWNPTFQQLADMLHEELGISPQMLYHYSKYEFLSSSHRYVLSASILQCTPTMPYNNDNMRSDLRDESPRYETPETQKMSAGRYIATRFSTLKPPMNKGPNPFKLLAILNSQQ